MVSVVMKRRGLVWLFLLFLGVAFGAGWVLTPDSFWAKDATTWQRMATPGALSAAHAHLEEDCKACHTPIRGAERMNCIACHATDERLLVRPETIFHAGIGSCGGCHVEHRGWDASITWMDHGHLARLEVDSLQKAAKEHPEWVSTAQHLDSWLRGQKGATRSIGSEQPEDLAARLLDCSGCHARKDVHEGVFGRDCVQCHETTRWTIAAYRHPPGRSTDCGQCHLAPESHFRGPFKAMCATQVNQCFMCHVLPTWTDIMPGPGWQGVRAKCE